MNILIVEDDPILSKKIESVFYKSGFAHNICIIPSYKKYLSLTYERYIFDIILLDINLKDKDFDGLNILKHIRKLDKKIPVIIMSGYTDYSILDSAFLLWAHDYIIKPFRVRELQIRIKKWFHSYVFSQYYSVVERLEYFEISYDMGLNEFFSWNKKIVLSKGDKYLLLLFMIHREKLLSHEFLLEKFWGCKEEKVKNKNIRIKVMRLRKILENYWLDLWIQTVPWEGYILCKR